MKRPQTPARPNGLAWDPKQPWRKAKEIDLIRARRQGATRMRHLVRPETERPIRALVWLNVIAYAIRLTLGIAALAGLAWLAWVNWPGA